MAKAKNRAADIMGGEKKEPKKKSGDKLTKKEIRELKRMILEKSANGGYIAEHEYKPGKEGEMSESERYALADLPGLHGHLDDQYGEKEEPDEEPEGEPELEEMMGAGEKMTPMPKKPLSMPM